MFGSRRGEGVDVEGHVRVVHPSALVVLRLADPSRGVRVSRAGADGCGRVPGSARRAASGPARRPSTNRRCRRSIVTANGRKPPGSGQSAGSVVWGASWRRIPQSSVSLSISQNKPPAPVRNGSTKSSVSRQMPRPEVFPRVTHSAGRRVTFSGRWRGYSAVFGVMVGPSIAVADVLAEDGEHVGHRATALQPHRLS